MPAENSEMQVKLTPGGGILEYDRSGQFITSGIPWPRGTVFPDDKLEMHEPTGSRIPLQTAPLAYWPDSSVKWSLLTAKTDISAVGKQSFIVRKSNPGDNTAEPAGSAEKLTVSKNRNSILLNTGVLRLRVDTASGGFITEAEVRKSNGRWHSVLNEHGIKLFVERCAPDRSGRQRFTNGRDDSSDRLTQPQPPAGFRQFAQDPEYEVSIIEKGPLRACLRITGTHVNKHGNRFCPYIVHLYVFQGSSRIELQHTLIYTGIPAQDLIAGFGLDVNLNLDGTDRRCHLAEETGPGIEVFEQITPAHPRWRQARLTQLAANAYRLEKQVTPACGPVKITEGGRNQGWAWLGDSQGGCLAAVRDFWQQYPKGFSINTEQKLLRIELWPDSVAPWDLRRYDHEWHPDLYEYCPNSLPDTFPEETHGARGIAKTHELTLDFQGTAPDCRKNAETALHFNQPLYLMATPEWYCGTKVMGSLHPHDGKRFARQEKLLTGYTDFMIAERERCNWYGMVDYGDVIQTHAREDYNQPGENPPPRRWLYDVGGHAWVNTEDRPDQWLWLAFFRTGRADYLAAATAMSRHNRDLDMYHWGNFKGCGSRHNVNHWGCADKEWRISTPISLRWLHYVTGDAWTRNVILETVKVYQSYGKRTMSLGPGGAAAFCGLLVKSELTGEKTDVEAVRYFADACSGMCLPNGEICARIEVDLNTGKGRCVGEDDMKERIFFLMGFGSMQTIIEVAELFRHEGIIAALRRHVDSRLQRPGRNTAAKLDDLRGFSYLMPLGFLARMTGEQKYLEAAAALFKDHRNMLEKCGGKGGCLETPPHLIPKGNGITGRKQTCGFGGVYTKMTFAFSALAQAKNRRD